MLDLLITNATIVDGSGAAPFQGHAGIEGDSISGLWQADPPKAALVIDAQGKLLASQSGARGGRDSIHVGSCSLPENKEFEFLTLEELGRRTGQSPFDAISDFMIRDGGMVSQIILQVSGSDSDEANLERLLAHSLGILATDANDYGKGLPHPAAYGAFPRVLSRFVREKRVCSIQEAIRKMTGRPAELFGIDRRGFIRERYFADLVLLDYDHLADTSTFRNPRSLAAGIEKVFVNGSLVLDHGRCLKEGAGLLLRRA